MKRRQDPSSIPWGPWTLGSYGLYINIFSAVFLLISIVFSFFPPAVPVTLTSMNWSCLVFGTTTIFGLIFYAVKGRKQYNGPIFERSVLPFEDRSD
jgi:choline transport protein